MSHLKGADDIPGDLVELYGYVNRALPDAELDTFVEAHENRLGYHVGHLTSF
jgi:hypothetical protein